MTKSLQNGGHFLHMLTSSWVARKRLKCGFYRQFSLWQFFCSELDFKKSCSFSGFGHIRLCLGWLGRPCLCSKMPGTRVLQMFCKSVFHVCLPLVKFGLATAVFANVSCGFVSTGAFKEGFQALLCGNTPP